MRRRVYLGSDAAGNELRHFLSKKLANDARVELIDWGDVAAEDPYPHIGLDIARFVAKEMDYGTRAILICGTGIGMAITANKVKGIRATVAHDSYSVERSILSNNCQILTLGARVIGQELAWKLVHEWLGYEFDPASASAAKVQIITNYEVTN